MGLNDGNRGVTTIYLHECEMHPRSTQYDCTVSEDNKPVHPGLHLETFRFLLGDRVVAGYDWCQAHRAIRCVPRGSKDAQTFVKESIV